METAGCEVLCAALTRLPSLQGQTDNVHSDRLESLRTPRPLSVDKQKAHVGVVCGHRSSEMRGENLQHGLIFSVGCKHTCSQQVYKAD